MEPTWTTPPPVMQRSIAGADGCPVSSGVVARMGPQIVPIRVYKEYGPDFCVMCFLIGKMFYVSFG